MPPVMIYPVTVTMPDGATYEKAKLFGSLDVTTVYDWPDGHDTPRVVVTAPAAPERGRRARTWTLATDDGVVHLAQGCGGCNPSRLKRWQPTPGAVRTETTTG